MLTTSSNLQLLTPQIVWSRYDKEVETHRKSTVQALIDR